MRKLAASENSAKDFLNYISLLRSLYLMYQNYHWQISGAQFYGNHLLFQRLYEGVAEDLDLAAEKCAGLYDAKFLDIHRQMMKIQKILAAWEISSNPKVPEIFTSALGAEDSFQKLSLYFYKKLEKNGDLTLGLDDFIMGAISNSEDRCYLLKQSL